MADGLSTARACGAAVLAVLALAAHGANDTVNLPPEVRCPGGAEVTVRAADPADAASACDGAMRALRFFAEAGLAAPPRTRIAIVPALPGELRGRAVGCYLRESHDIVLLSYGQFVALGEWFRVSVSRELYASSAAHEMAHAVAGCHSEPARLPVAAHEYVAYVVMFATMQPTLREQVLARFPGQGFRSTLQINDIMHIIEPNQFGADAWRHYLSRRDRSAWLREVITGHIVQDMPTDGP